MELKVKMFEPVLEEKSFQSHLYGIESNMGAPYKVGGGGFNRTFMELKGQHRGTRNGAKGRFNRTFMELKVERQRAQAVSARVSIAPLWN